MPCAKPFGCNQTSPAPIPRSPPSCARLGDNEGAAAEARTGAQIGQQKTGLQAATLATSSGRRLLNAGDVDGAITQFRSAINSSPNFAQAHYQLAIALRRKGDQDEAAKEFRKAAELDPQLAPPAS